MDKHDALGALKDKLTELIKDGSNAAQQWDNYLTDAATGSPASIATWLRAHDEQCVNTLQASVRYGEVRHLWTPGRRTIDAYATYAKLNDSARYYAGVHALRASDTVFVGYDSDMGAVIVYAVTEAGPSIPEPTQP